MSARYWSRSSTNRASTITRNLVASEAPFSCLGRQPTEQVRSLRAAVAFGSLAASRSSTNRASTITQRHAFAGRRLGRCLGRQPTEQVRSRWRAETPLPWKSGLGRQPTEQVRSPLHARGRVLDLRVSVVNQPSKYDHRLQLFSCHLAILYSSIASTYRLSVVCRAQQRR